MERTDTRNEVNELDIIITDYIPDHMPDKFWEAYHRLLQLARQAGWPEEIYAQYIRVLDERDNALDKLECLEKQSYKQ